MADEHPDDDGDDIAEAGVGAHQRPAAVGKGILALAEGNRLAQHHDEEHTDEKRDELGQDGARTNYQHVDPSSRATAAAPARGRRWPGPRDKARPLSPP